MIKNEARRIKPAKQSSSSLESWERDLEKLNPGKLVRNLHILGLYRAADEDSCDLSFTLSAARRLLEKAFGG